jgi:hypothetical protein
VEPIPPAACRLDYAEDGYVREVAVLAGRSISCYQIVKKQNRRNRHVNRFWKKGRILGEKKDRTTDGR